MLSRFFRKSGARPEGSVVLKPLKRVSAAPKPWTEPDWFQEVRALEDGVQLGDVLLRQIHHEIALRVAQAGVESDWPAIQVTGLAVRRAGLPDWWHTNGNLMLAGPDAKVELVFPFEGHPGNGGLVVAGAGACLGKTSTTGTGGFVVAGDRANLWASHIDVIATSTVLVAEQTSSTFYAHLDARNGGAIIVGADNMWANGVHLVTDDEHAIRDIESGIRLNVFGGRIIIERHVWLCADVRLAGDCRIGEGSIIGMGSMVKNSILPSNSVCVGWPAKRVRSGIVWTRTDEP